MKPLRVPNYRNLWFGVTTSAFADTTFTVVLAIRVVEMGGSAADLGFIYAARSVAMLLFVMGGGVWVDRVRRSRVLVASDAIRAFALLGFFMLPDSAPTTALVGLSMVVGLGEALFQPAFTSLLPRLLDRETLQPANALNTLSLRMSAALGPGLGGLLVSAFSARILFAMIAALYAVSALVEMRISDQAPERTTRKRGMFEDVKEGLAIVISRRWVLAVILVGTVHTMLVLPPATVMLPIVATKRYSEAAFGYLLALRAIGAVIGALIGMKWCPQRRGVVGLAGVVPFVGVLLGLMLKMPFILLGASLLGTGIGFALFGIYWYSALQEQIESGNLGKVTAVDNIGTFGLQPAGYALVGPAVSIIGVNAVLGGSAVIALATIFIPLLVSGVSTFGKAMEQVE